MRSEVEIRNYTLKSSAIGGEKEDNIHGLIIELLAEMPVLSHYYTVDQFRNSLSISYI